MTHTAIDEIIRAYVKADLSPKPPERKMVEKRYDELEKFLEGRTFQSGSYARHTSTTPVNDLDVFYILPEGMLRRIVEAKISPTELQIDDILQSLADALQKQYGSTARVLPQPHSVGIFFGRDDEFSIDAVPAQPAPNGLFWVPESSHLSVAKRRALYGSQANLKLQWIMSDPKGYIEQATTLDARTYGRFRRAVKIARKWRLGCKQFDGSFPLKSFHLEVIVTELLKKTPASSCLDVLQKTIESLPDAVQHAQYPDRADPAQFIDAYVRDLTEGQRQVVQTEADRASIVLGQIASATTEAQVIKGIEELVRLRTDDVPTGNDELTSSRKSPAYSKPYAR